MISGLFILVLTLISLFLLWKNHSESKQFSLDKLELENKIVKLNQELNKSTSQCTKLEDQVKTIQVEVPIGVDSSIRLSSEMKELRSNETFLLIELKVLVIILLDLLLLGQIAKMQHCNIVIRLKTNRCRNYQDCMKELLKLFQVD